MRILGISPLASRSGVCLIEEGKIIAALGEAQIVRQKNVCGFPHQALRKLLARCQVTTDDIDAVAYAGAAAHEEDRLLHAGVRRYQTQRFQHPRAPIFSLFRNLPRTEATAVHIPGMSDESLFVPLPWYHAAITAIRSQIAHLSQARREEQWLKTAAKEQKQREEALLEGIRAFNLERKLTRIDLQRCHALSAYAYSGLENALIVILETPGSGVYGSVFAAQNGQIERLHDLYRPAGVGDFVRMLVRALGFDPADAHTIIPALAAYADSEALFSSLHPFFEVKDGDILSQCPPDLFFFQYLASRFSKPLICAACQNLLKTVVRDYITYYQTKTGLPNLVLGGRLMANGELVRRVSEIPGIKTVFVEPTLGEIGPALGAALAVSDQQKLTTVPDGLFSPYLGPGFSEEKMKEALRQEGLRAETPPDLESRLAELLAEGHTIARFDGRMSYGPRGLGNRTILCRADNPALAWRLRAQLRQPPFLPLTSATRSEQYAHCYAAPAGVQTAVQFSTLRAECTEAMRQQCPAAVHVDGTACPHLVYKQVNEPFYRILEAYEQRTGLPCVITTNLALADEPMASSPLEAIRVFKLGRLNYLALGPYLVEGSHE